MLEITFFTRYFPRGKAVAWSWRLSSISCRD